MKLQNALDIIKGKNKPQGFRVTFEVVERGVLRSDYFPDRGEPLIPTEDEAWDLANKFAVKTYGRCVNIYVIDHDYTPVTGYAHKRIINR